MPANDANEIELCAYFTVYVDLFGLLTVGEKNCTCARYDFYDVAEIRKSPLICVNRASLTWYLDQAIRDEKGLVSDVERDAAAACHGVSSSWQGIVNRHPHIASRASAHANRTTITQSVGARSFANG